MKTPKIRDGCKIENRSRPVVQRNQLEIGASVYDGQPGVFVRVVPVEGQPGVDRLAAVVFLPWDAALAYGERIATLARAARDAGLE